MSIPNPKGLVYRCGVCGSEVTVLARDMGRFDPHCCSRPMSPRTERLSFFSCPVCGAEIAVLNPGKGAFSPRCCNRGMERHAA